MKNLVITVSPDSSLELLAPFADVVVLDKGLAKNSDTSYGTVYIRSHFSQQSTMPQNFRGEIDGLLQQARNKNPNVRFIDDMDNVDTIIAFEDKWQQYETFSDFMPKTQLLNDELNTASFKRPVFKSRLSSRGNGVTWNREETTGFTGDWIIQESIDIAEELRIYVIRGEVYQTGAVRQSKTSEQSTQAVDSRRLTQDEIDFSLRIARQTSGMDIIGLDIARSLDGKLYLMEVNRSPGFAAFSKLTGVNLAGLLYN